jgi:L-ascorbate metabolism protein UlaG (beta-lactamase superfamily)
MKITWYGHSAFLIASDRGVKIITDPYDPGAYGDKLSYGKITDQAEIGAVDVLLVPVGGFYTIDAKEAAQIAESLKPKVLIPMHFKTEKCGFPIAPVEDFLTGKPRVKQPGTSEATFDKTSLPRQMEIVVLTHAL